MYSKRNVLQELFCDEYKVFEREDIIKSYIGTMIGPDFKSYKSNPHGMNRLNTAWGKLYKKNVIGDIRFVDTKKIGPEDLWFNLMVAANCEKIIYMSNAHYYYEKGNSSSILHKYDDKLIDKRFCLYEMIEEYIDIYALDKYRRNLENRIISEQFQLIINICRAEIDFSLKCKEINKLIIDSRYKEEYYEIPFSSLPLWWRLFFELSKKRKSKTLAIIVCAMTYFCRYL